MAEEKSFKGHSEEEINAALDLLKRTRAQRTKQLERMKNDPVAKAKAKDRATRMRIKATLLQKKALQAGLTVTEAEIDAAMKGVKK